MDARGFAPVPRDAFEVATRPGCPTADGAFDPYFNGVSLMHCV